LTAVHPLDVISAPSSKPPAPAGSIKTVYAFPLDVNTTSDIRDNTINRKKFFIVKTLSNIANVKKKKRKNT